MMIKIGRASAFALSAFLVTLMLISAASAQTKKKKRHVTHRSTAAKKTTATNSDAGVVSLADQYQDGSTQIIDPSASPSRSPETTLPDETTRKLKDLQTRIKKLETTKPDDYDTKQKRLLTNLDILTKAEQRSEDLRKQRFELVEKENSINLRLAQIEIDSRPEVIERSVATMGSLRPEELREAKRKGLDAEKQSLQSLLNDVTTTRAALDQSLLRSDALVDKLREKLEKDIDDALTD
ncbi:MAG TPA: hypothetical protein VGJ02_06255, partial [Pyrinomonadaceae bacterium]